MKIRDYQLEAAEQMTSGDLLVLPTGTGKTRVLCEVAAREVFRGGAVLWVAHRNELLKQASDSLRAAWLTPGQNVFVHSIQEMRTCKLLLRRPITAVIVDEAHHLPSDDWSKLRDEQFPDVALMGATATPERADGRGLAPYFTRIVAPLTTRQAIERGYLVPFEVLRPERALAPGELAQRPVQAYLDHASHTKAIAFYPSVELAIQDACAFRDAGVRAAAVWGAMGAGPREKALDLFARGDLDMLTSVNLLTEGFDVPDVETVILARGFGSLGGYIQAIGRGARLAEGKVRCLVLDLRGNYHSHGEPDQDLTWHLEGKAIRRKTDEIDVRFCPVCGSPVMTPVCERCGHSGEMRLRKPKILGLPIDRFAQKREESNEERGRTLARWMRECRDKGWRDGQALHRYRAVYGDWPSPEVSRIGHRFAQFSRDA